MARLSGDTTVGNKEVATLSKGKLQEKLNPTSLTQSINTLQQLAKCSKLETTDAFNALIEVAEMLVDIENALVEVANIIGGGNG